MTHEAERIVTMIVGQHDDDVARLFPRTLLDLRCRRPGRTRRGTREGDKPRYEEGHQRERQCVSRCPNHVGHLLRVTARII